MAKYQIKTDEGTFEIEDNEPVAQAPPTPDLRLRAAQLPSGLQGGPVNPEQNTGSFKTQAPAPVREARRQAFDKGMDNTLRYGLPAAGATAAVAAAPFTAGGSLGAIPAMTANAANAGLGAGGGEALLNLINKLRGQQVPEGTAAFTDPLKTGLGATAADLAGPAGLAALTGARNIPSSALGLLLNAATRRSSLGPLLDKIAGTGETAAGASLGPSAFGTPKRTPSQIVADTMQPVPPTSVSLKGLLQDVKRTKPPVWAGQGETGAPFQAPASNMTQGQFLDATSQLRSGRVPGGIQNQQPAPPTSQQTQGIGTQPQSVLPTPKSILGLLKKMGGPQEAASVEGKIRPGTEVGPDPGVQPGKTVPPPTQDQIELNKLSKLMRNPNATTEQLQDGYDTLRKKGLTDEQAKKWIQDLRFKF